MKKIITEQEIKQIIAELSEAPAKYVFNIIYKLLNLPILEEKKEEKPLKSKK